MLQRREEKCRAAPRAPAPSTAAADVSPAVPPFLTPQLPRCRGVKRGRQPSLAPAPLLAQPRCSQDPNVNIS